MMACICSGFIHLCVGLCLSTVGVTWAKGVVEGFEGEAVVLPCSISIRGHLIWRCDIVEDELIRTSNDEVVISPYSRWKNVISLVSRSNNLRISPLRRFRDDGVTFYCTDSENMDRHSTTVRVLAKISGSSIEPTINGKVTVTEGKSRTLTCAATGNPNPPPSYSWTVNNGGVRGQGSSYNLTLNRSMRSVTCTAINNYANGSVLSTAETTATLNVLYLDAAKDISSVSETENEVATLLCPAQGNPPPAFEWRRSGSAEVKSTSADYRIENVQRSDAGEYTCNVTNSVGNQQTTMKLVVQYPSEVTVRYDHSSQTLNCSAMGNPDLHTFSPWEHRLGGALIRRLGTQRKGTWVTYTLPGTVTYTDTGDYVCSATNNVNYPQTGRIYVAPLSPAVFENHSKKVSISLGKSKTVSLPFYSKSSSGSLGVSWKKAGQSGGLQSHWEEPGLVSLVVYGQQVSLPGTVSVLMLTDVRQADEGIYNVTVTNDINGVIKTTSTSFYVDVTEKGSTEKGFSVEVLGVIVGGVLGGLATGVIVTVFAVMLWMRSRTRGFPEGADNREMSPAGEVNREIRNLARVADTPLDSAVNIDYNFEPLVFNNTRSPGSRGQHYASLRPSSSCNDYMYENIDGIESSERAKQRTEGAIYENV